MSDKEVICAKCNKPKSHTVYGICYDCENKVNNQSIPKMVTDLTINELYELMIKAVKECNKQDAEQSESEYQKLTGGKVPKEY